MDETYSLMEFLHALAGDAALRDSFTHDPQAALHSYGLDHLGPADVQDALVLVEDNQTVEFSRDYDVGHAAHGDISAFGSGTSGDGHIDHGAFASGGGAPVDDFATAPHDGGDSWGDRPVDDPFTPSGDDGVHDRGHLDPGTHDPFDDEGADHGATDGPHHAGHELH